MRLEGRKALVTGGASGIGAAIARRLAAEGAEVTIGDLNLEGATEVAGEVSGLPIELDVTDLGSAQAAVDSAGKPLDILINNAGTDEFGFFTQTTPEQWEKVIAVNLTGVLNCTFAALPGMQEAGYGRIVNIASEAGPGRVQGIGRLLGGQGRRDRLHQGDGPRERALRDQCERDRAGADRDAPADARARVRRNRREDHREHEGGHPAAAAGPAGGGGRGGRLPGLRRRLVRHWRDARRLAAAWGWWADGARARDGAER